MLSGALHRIRPTPVVASIAIGGISLGLMSKLMVRNIHADSGAPQKVFGGGLAMVSLPLESSMLVNHNTKLLRFKLPSNNHISGLSLTGAVLTLSWPKGRWLPVARPYTPISASDQPGVVDLLVKRYPDGKQSSHLHSLQPGETLRFAAAIPGVTWKANSVPHVTLIAGGAGITPIFQLAQGILRNPEDKTVITLVYGANTDEDVLLKKEFDGFEKEFPGRFKAVYTVSRPFEKSPFRGGYVTKQLLEEVTESPLDRKTKVFVCGPPSMETSLVGSRSEQGILEQLGYRKDQIHKF
ncbi:oxidoreductase NAD-binding domain-containing protein [Aaosphaeria arxii CBS 175.79]|uniref:NADH-cytochrome b5 reductase n=1 Tax=Aaosphaeria arxii CBS 175.79 TaxID=1450172 RepID=A0A6A5Y2T7_9PLEO|nr:oxidoreductase NAD-binding domain-containing protein [Aaosphaeria arxii CBS 175.79]KAF2019546.1 oxidoreductase NAD-binding domain-containing protein [Aaosphaeria arxii CBS 175.79]